MNYQKRILLLSFIDAVIVTAAVGLAYLIRFDFRVEPRFFALLPYVMAAHVILTQISFQWVKMYRRVWQYASIGELVQVAKAAAFSEAVFFLLHNILRLIDPELVVPRSIYLLAFVLIILGVGGSRLFWRMVRDSYLSPRHRTGNRRTLIVGAGQAGVLVARELKQSGDSDLYPVAFVDDNPNKWNLEVLGLSVLGGCEQIPEIVRDHDIEKIIIAIPSASRSETARVIEICKDTGAQIKMLPKVSDLISKRFSVSMIREVSVEDLLGRDPVKVDLEGIANYVTGQVVLVTGAGGSIGSELCRQIAAFVPERLLLLGHGENSIYDIEMELHKIYPDQKTAALIADIQDRQRLNEVFAAYRPVVVFHAAAHKHVPLMESNPVEAVKNNVLGTRNVAECAHEYGVSRFVMVSTDKAVNPTSIMGTTKRVAELFVQGLGRTSPTKFVAVRFGNVLGSRGSVIPLFKKQIAAGGPVTVTDPHMVRYFMTIPEAVQLVIQAGAFAEGGEIFILDMGKPVKINDLARDLIRLSGLEPDRDIEIKYTGIRPGEKLYEEILTNEEGITATRHDRIFVGQPGEYSWEELQFMLRKLEKAAARNQSAEKAGEIRELLQQIVPSYHLPVYERAAVDEILQSRSETAAGK
ncbi:polysaccharide biosynthesis protein [Phosphitispora fastidiosa]|uniref:polysaccharide biosynthesis protein n=1 Tax=Phosphitispora fastidiosa TaxID=2837202 RepID=UPI001E4AF945|nr:nucleoside-diphosphate sugar epimerase/dehydratase [Phosphitispora fastidiosa]MBU7007228.1 FlaA1/EpsC-like NDP-sugar epimerase [Phosphitispora fastidiosa]